MAGIGTAAVVALILILLFLGSVTRDRAALAEASIAEPMEDEVFIEPVEEPELLEEKGEEDAPNLPEMEEAPSEQGEPEPAPVDNERRIVNGENTKPAPQVEKPITQKHPSPVKATEPPKSNKPDQKVTSKVAKGFSGRNGKPDGKAGGFGTGGKGTASVRGNSRGRSMLSCPRPSVALKQQVTIVVSVQVSEDGRVVKASASGGAAQYLRDACVQAARQSRWTPKPGAGTVAGTITFTIIPKV